VLRNGLPFVVRAEGGEVRVLGLVENSSTTGIVEKIRRQP